MEIDAAKVLDFLKASIEYAGVALTPIAAGQAIVAVARHIDGTAAMATRLNASTDTAFQDMARDAYTACRGVIAHLFHVEPTDELVDGVMNTVHEGPSGPSRVRRLLGEAAKSASSERRRILASVLYGLPFTTATDSERDRTDMLVERLVPEDIELLGHIVSLQASADSVCYVENNFTGDIWIAGLKRDDSQTKTSGYFEPNGTAFAALEASGCVYRSTGFGTGVEIRGKDETGIALEITELGHLLIDALSSVQPEFASQGT